MVLKKKITVSWSGGKDSALSLFKILQLNQFEIVHLHCILGKTTGRVGMHGVSEDLIDLQANALGIPLEKAYLEDSESNLVYEKLIRSLYNGFRKEGITHIVFGDIFLDDLKSYREKLLEESGLVPIFPIWKKDSLFCIKDFIANGFRTVVCAADERCFSAGLLGKQINEDFLNNLPEGVDPSGENGEFHTFVFDGPLFLQPIRYSLGSVHQKKYFFSVNADQGTVQTETSMYFQELLS